MRKKLAVIRQDNARPCPFGLDIAISCRAAGDSVDRMQALDELPPEKRDKYRKANRRVYRHHKTDERCVYADKIVEGKDIVNCDYGDYGERISDFPIRPSPFYPRVFTGLIQAGGLYAYPMGAYFDNSEAQQIFSGIHAAYASTGEINFKKLSMTKPDKLQEEMYYYISSVL